MRYSEIDYGIGCLARLIAVLVILVSVIGCLDTQSASVRLSFVIVVSVIPGIFQCFDGISRKPMLVRIDFRFECLTYWFLEIGVRISMRQCVDDV